MKKFLILITISFLLVIKIFSLEVELKEYYPDMKYKVIYPWIEIEDDMLKSGILLTWQDDVGYKKIIMKNYYNLSTKRYNFDYNYSNGMNKNHYNIGFKRHDLKESLFGTRYEIGENNGYFNLNINRSNSSRTSTGLFFTKFDNITHNVPLFTKVYSGVYISHNYFKYRPTDDIPDFVSELSLFSVKLSKNINNLYHTKVEVDGIQNIYDSGDLIINLKYKHGNLNSLKNNYANLLLKNSDIGMRGLNTEVYADKFNRYSADLIFKLYKDYGFSFFHNYGIKLFLDVFSEKAELEISGIDSEYTTYGATLAVVSYFSGKVPYTLSFTNAKEKNSKSSFYVNLMFHISNF